MNSPFFRFVAIFIVTLLLVMALAHSVARGDHTAFEIVNGTPYTISRVEIAPQRSTEWSHSLLGASRIEPGRSARIDPGPGIHPVCDFDVRVIFDRLPDRQIVRDVPLCAAVRIILEGGGGVRFRHRFE